MEIVEVLAIIGLIGTFAIPFLALMFQKRINEKGFNKISKTRKNAIKGRWTGKFIQENLKNQKPINGTVDGDLFIKGKLIKGEIRIENKTHKTKPRFVVKGGLQNDRFLVLNYENVKNEVIQFGKLILEFSAKADSLKGKFVSYGAESEEIINGELELKKE